jgi:hypothetical protein
MKFSNKISKLIGTYSSLSIPVLGELEIQNGINFLINKKFHNLFLKDKPQENHLEIIKKQVERIKVHQKIHHKGNIYNVDETTVSKGVKYYFYSLALESVHHSFLWLKHDLLNILNPIMGFADVLAESEEIATEDQILAQKIRSNSNNLYHQIQKLSLLQSLNQEDDNKNGTYELSDFIKEITNQLLANNSIDHIEKIEISHNGKVSDRIIQSDFRSSLEEHLKYLISFQDKKELKILALHYNDTFRIKFQITQCVLPSQYLKEIDDVEQFINNSQAITKLQIPSLNYLILSELCHSIGASVFLKTNRETVVVELQLPSLSSKTDIKQSETQIPQGFRTKQEASSLKSVPPQLQSELKQVCSQFDGLLILDEWQKLSKKLQRINTVYQSPELENIILEIDTGVQSFDVEKLRGLYQTCHNFLIENN